jgi:hypothetical protein
MAKSNTPRKPRAAARTIEEQIAALQEKQAAKQAKVEAKAKAEIDTIEASIVRAEERLINLYAKRTSARESLGLPADGTEELFAEETVAAE